MPKDFKFCTMVPGIRCLCMYGSEVVKACLTYHWSISPPSSKCLVQFVTVKHIPVFTPPHLPKSETEYILGFLSPSYWSLKISSLSLSYHLDREFILHGTVLLQGTVCVIIYQYYYSDILSSGPVLLIWVEKNCTYLYQTEWDFKVGHCIVQSNIHKSKKK